MCSGPLEHQSKLRLRCGYLSCEATQADDRVDLSKVRLPLTHAIVGVICIRSQSASPGARA